MDKLEGKERLIHLSLLLIAFSALSVLGLITLFIFSEGLPIMIRHGLKNFLGNLDWYPTEGSFGLLPMIIGSLLVTAGAMLVGVPLGLAGAIYLTQFSSKKVRIVVKPLIELLAGIPSVVYGFIGVVILVPLIRTYLGGPGLSVMAAAIILGIMILPTILSISIDSLMALPPSYREGSIALGATQWQTVRLVLLPAARSGVVASIILGMGRAVGETMAVIMIAGNAINLPRSILDPVRTLTANIALEMGYASGEHRQALFATGVILFIIIMVLNTIANLTSKRMSS